MLRFSKFKMKSHICWCVIDYTFMVIDYQWLFSKNSFPKVTFLQVTCFWRFFQKSYLFKWLVLKELPRVTSFDLSHQETINMWPWHETFEQSHSDLSSLSTILSFNLSFNIFFHFFQNFLISSSLMETMTIMSSPHCATIAVHHHHHAVAPHHLPHALFSGEQLTHAELLRLCDE